jgi:hypothetical protein
LSASPDESIKLYPQISLELDRLNRSSREQFIEYLAESAGRVRTLEEKLRGAELENRYLRELLRLARIEKYGSGSEKLSDEQLALLELEPGVSQAEVQAESERAQLKLPLRQRHQPAKHPGRQELPAHLPRVEKIIPCTPEQCVCAQCGNHKELIGYETSEQLDVEPAKTLRFGDQAGKARLPSLRRTGGSSARCCPHGLSRKVWPAIGRKNWLHVGSERAGPRVAAIISIVETCRRLSIPVRNYLGSVLPGLANFPINRIARLTPSAWAARI